LRIGLYIKFCFAKFERSLKWLYQKEDIQVQDRVKEEVLRKFTCRVLLCALIANHPNCRTAYAVYAAITKAGK
jgi:hypothetical protein